MQFGLALRAFWNVLLNREVATRFAGLIDPPAPSGDAAEPPRKPASPPPSPPRSDALALLETLQREARFVDIVKEPLDQFSDAEVGAAARDVLRKSGDVLDRLFALEPITSEPEGSAYEAPAGFDSGRIRLTGNVAGEPPFKGSIAHHGWEATRCELPQYNGSPAAVLVVAPLELQIQ